ncbi:MAG TPA: hypothetical protein VLN48_09140 [Bryobacteraceae bacterium]|nr:hypothetical protein [Bryobacteraceae bacterium]
MDTLKMNCGRLFIAALLLPLGAPAQWINYPDPGIPRLKNGKPNLTAPAPRRDGKPDLTGVWLHERTPDAEFKRMFGDRYEAESQAALIGMELESVHKYALNILVDFGPKESPLRPEAEALMKKRAAERRVDNVCHGEYGWPVAGLLAEPFKIVQAPKETMILYEVDGLHRQVFTDGRPFPATFEFPAYLGYSTGRWEGDTFVVETRGFNDRTPLDAFGHPRSEDMHVTERFRRRDFGHLEVEMTFDDPQMYSRPFTVKVLFELVADNDIFEMFCTQNEKDRVHMVK